MQNNREEDSYNYGFVILYVHVSTFLYSNRTDKNLWTAW
jgi:hypothetical protein